MATDRPRASFVPLPQTPVAHLVTPLARFLRVEAASGVVLLLAAVSAVVLANSSHADSFLEFWRSPVGIRVGSFEVVYSLRHWIDHGLMTIFFFVVGLEVKREIVLGELRDPRAAALPIVAALGGMLVPAGLFLALQWGEPTVRGWGIPMATDIAFVVGCMALLGRRVTAALRVLVVTLAVTDDIGAILVIALGYSVSIGGTALACGAGGMGIVVVLAKSGVRSVGLYTVLGVCIWWAFHESGIHATIAGVILGLLTPARPWVNRGRLRQSLGRGLAYLGGGDPEDDDAEPALARTLERTARESASPLERLEAALHPWVSFGILPLFALANAGVPLSSESFREPVAVAVLVGLVVGKPVGIVLASWLAVRAGLARLPDALVWRTIFGGGVLAGIGFTMSLFIAGLALEPQALDAARAGVLAASALSAAFGLTLLWFAPARGTGALGGRASPP